MNNTRVQIKNPCHLNWDDLRKLENTTDKHCDLCNWHIKDFRSMSDGQIAAYLATKKKEKICCVMRSEPSGSRLQRTFKAWNHNVKASFRESRMKTFLLFSIGLLMFTAGCDKDDDENPLILGEPEVEQPKLELETTKVKDSVWIRVPLERRDR